MSKPRRIKGAALHQGVREYEPLRRDRRKRLEELRTGGGRIVSKQLKAEICRELITSNCCTVNAVEGERAAAPASKLFNRRFLSAWETDNDRSRPAGECASGPVSRSRAESDIGLLGAQFGHAGSAL
ncbi:hypothetical protein CEJ86_31725 [Sinorhizobium meliloti]|uniref:Uncharacterized protein n=1 Tax=Rhizobium meliloti TaxID=382 RepID=A0A2J0YTG2_RHIML|nr:hypothetical protein CEJ86_31725 [Sinorhizobium meliloti]